MFDNTPANVLNALSGLNAKLLEEDLEFFIYPGSEVYMNTGVADRILNGEVLTLNDNDRYVLVEYSFTRLPIQFENELFRLTSNGITPVVAHPERNTQIRRSIDILYKMIEMGCLIQVTADSITGDFGKEIMEFSHEIVFLRLAHIIASDAHSSWNRPMRLSEAAEIAEEILEDPEYVDNMVFGYPKAIVDGEAIDMPSPQPQKKAEGLFKSIKNFLP
jgi:protein-tyrosine phosphatase